MSKYNVLGLLGQGLFSTVYLAENSEGKQIALKYYTNKSNEDVRLKFTTEAATLSQIQHDNILKVHDFGEDEKGLFLVTDYVEYGNLKGRIDVKGALDLDRTLVVALSVLKALEVLHNADKVHADVRPENLFNTADGYLKLADFGTLLDRVPLDGLPASAFYYAAPEILKDSQKIDKRADIYGLGATLYHIFTGKPPYADDNPLKVVEMHRNGRIPDAADIVECPPAFSAVLKKMLAKEVSCRYQTVLELEGDLNALRAGITAIDRLPSFLRKNIAFESNLLVENNLPERESKIAMKEATESDEGLSSQSNSVNPNKLQFKMKLATACLSLVICLLALIYFNLEAVQEETDMVSVKVTPSNSQVFKESKGLAENEGETNQEISSVKVDNYKTPHDMAVMSLDSIDEDLVKLESKDAITFKSYSEELFPLKLISIDQEGFRCIFELSENDLVKKLEVLVGEESGNIKLLAIEDESAIVDFNGKAYRLDSDKSYRQSYKLILESSGKNFAFTSESLSTEALTLIKFDGQITTFEKKSGESFDVKLPQVASADLFPLGDIMHKAYLEKALGSIISLVKFQHDYFPVIVNSIANGVVNYSVMIDGTPVNQKAASKMDTLAGRYVLKFIGSNWILLKDNISDKNIRVKVGQKTILSKSAILKYEQENHKVFDGDLFFGCEVQVSDSEVVLKYKEVQHFISEEKISVFLRLSSSDKQHLVLNCQCYSNDKESFTKVARPISKVIEEEEVEGDANQAVENVIASVEEPVDIDRENDLSFVKSSEGELEIVVHDVIKKYIYYSLFQNGTFIGSKVIRTSTVINGIWELRLNVRGEAILKRKGSRRELPLPLSEKVTFGIPYVKVIYRGEEHVLKSGQRFLGYLVRVADAQLSLLSKNKSIALDLLDRPKSIPPLIDEGRYHKMTSCSCSEAHPISESKNSLTDLVVNDKYKDDPRRNALYYYLAQTMDIDLEYFLLFSKVNVTLRKDGGLGSSTVAYVNYKAGKFLDVNFKYRGDRIPLEELTFKAGVMEIYGHKVKYTKPMGRDYKSLMAKRNLSVYSVSFWPDNYFSVKRLFKHLRFGGGGKTYEPGKNSLTNRETRQSERLVYEFDDANQTVIFNGQRYKYSKSYNLFTSEEGTSLAMNDEQSLYEAYFR